MKRSVTVELGKFATEAVAGEEGSLPARLGRAIRCYLGDREPGRSGWAYPDFRRGGPRRQQVRVELSLDDGLLRSLEAEAESQGVSVDRLVEHAALYLASEVDAGRITRRILDDIEDLESGD